MSKRENYEIISIRQRAVRPRQSDCMEIVHKYASTENGQRVHLYCEPPLNYLNIIHTRCALEVYLCRVNYEMPEEFNETLILLGKLVGSKSQTKTIHTVRLLSKNKRTKSGKTKLDFIHIFYFFFVVGRKQPFDVQCTCRCG